MKQKFQTELFSEFHKDQKPTFEGRSDAHKIYNFSNFCAVCFRFLCTLFGKMSIASDDTHIKSFLKQKKLLRIALHTEPLKTESLFWAHFVGSLNFSTVVINYSQGELHDQSGGKTSGKGENFQKIEASKNISLKLMLLFFTPYFIIIPLGLSCFKS